MTDWEVFPSLKLGDFTLEIELSPLSEELQEVANRELRETPERQKESLDRFKELLKGTGAFIIS